MTNKRLVLSILVAALMVASGLTAITLSPGNGVNSSSSVNTLSANNVYLNSAVNSAASSNTATSASGLSAAQNTASTAQSGYASQYISAAKQSNVPLKYVYFPAAPSKSVISNGIVMPGYLQGPAPFGIGAYGIKNVSGSLTAYNYSSNGFQANLNVSQLSAFDLNTYDPNGITVQLNTIMNGTTIKGTTGYTYWTQNVAFYDSFSHQFEMEDNIWNFSSPTAAMPAGTIYNHTAALYPYYYAYIGVGPLINNVSAPFNLTLTLESAVINDMNTVFFNYSLTFTNTSTGLLNTIGGIFDEVVFNSQVIQSSSAVSTPQANFLVDGSKVTPLGFINYDAEVTIEGPGGGSQIDIANIVGNMTLKYNDTSGSYVNVPSAYDVGSETGETSTGIAESWTTSGVARLSSGPSLVTGMWGVNTYTGTTHYTGTIAPSNSFMFVAPGSMATGGSIAIGPGVYSQYGYVPMTASGSYSFYLPTLTAGYSYELMLSDYDMKSGPLSAVEGTLTLTPDTSMGVYTPLYAMNNAQLANISSSGTGTSTSPYLAVNNQNGYINSLFGMFGDYGFPVFSGVMISGTTDYLNFNNSPSFQIMYQQGQSLLYMAELYGMGSIDYLNYVLYNTEYVSIYNASLIGGDQPANWEAGFYGASLILWNDTNDLVANNTFVNNVWTPYNEEILIYNPATQGSDNYIVGNYFEDMVYNIGIMIDSSNNAIFNNYFDMLAANVYEMPYDLYTGANEIYQNTWYAQNISSLTWNGYTLAGNILGGSIISGNFWNDYYYGATLPWNDSGSIAMGGDYAPLYLNTTYLPTYFYEMGLPAGTSWSVTINGITHTSTGSMILFMAEQGIYTVTATANSPYAEFLYGGTTVIDTTGAYSTSTPFVFSPYYALTVNETGLPTGYTWAAVLNDRGAVFTSGSISDTNSTTIYFEPGLYVMANEVYGSYYSFPESYSYVGGENLVPLFSDGLINVSFSPLLSTLSLDLNGMAASDSWSVQLDTVMNNGSLVLIGNYTETGPTATFSAVNSEIQAFLTTPGYVLDQQGPVILNFAPGSGTFTINVEPAVSTTFQFNGLPSGTGLTLYISSADSPWYISTTTTASSFTTMVPVDSTIDVVATPESGNYNVFANSVYLTGSTTIQVMFTQIVPSQSTVTFTESGLSSGATWQVTFNGLTKTSTTSTITFTATPGIYYYQVYSAGMTSPQSSGSLNVQSTSASVSVTFMPKTYTVTFVIAGLPANQEWNVTFNGQSVVSTSAGAVFNATAGTYNYSVAGVSGYELSNSSSSLTISHDTVVVVSFSKVPANKTMIYLAYAGFVGLGLLVGVVLAMLIPKGVGKKG